MIFKDIGAPQEEKNGKKKVSSLPNTLSEIEKYKDHDKKNKH